MANRHNKYPENARGQFYVDTQCIDCDLCRQTAPANFTRNEKRGYTYISEQPETPSEEKLCRKAIEECPVETIGCDG